MCEGADFVKQEGVFVCQSCDLKYSVEEAKKRMMTESTTDVPGTGKVDNSAKLDGLYQAARRAKNSNNFNQAFKYYEQIMMEDLNSWEPTFYVEYTSAVQEFKKGEIDSSISTIVSCLDSVFDLIENIQDIDEQKLAAEEVNEQVGSLDDAINEHIYKKIDENLKRIVKNFSERPEFDSLMDQHREIIETRYGYDSYLEKMSTSLERRLERLNKIVAERRFKEYWDAHQSEKAELESEKKSLIEQIAALNKEISTVPENIDGYADMVELKNKIQKLTYEKSTLGFLKFKEKKAIQEQIDSSNNTIASIQARINSAIEEVQKRIPPLESRIEAIDTELTKPR